MGAFYPDSLSDSDLNPNDQWPIVRITLIFANSVSAGTISSQAVNIIRYDADM